MLDPDEQEHAFWIFVVIGLLLAAVLSILIHSTNGV